MPGILPMKMIRVGVSSQNRIAQACDRCRSKKIRCDGVRPCCTQCANVGFECKTSDKLSRRAFPRGYTESLEDRVRDLEAEVRELKALLDEKDEKIDILSRIHNFARSPKHSLSSTNSVQVKAEDESSRDDMVLVELPAAVHPMTSSAGTSTTSALIEAFEEKVHDSRRTCPDIVASTLLKPQYLACKASAANLPSNLSPVPPRLLSDQYMNLFFQEWQPLLPILHRPTFLRTYEQYLADSDAATWQSNRQAVAQLFLIFEIAAHSSSSKAKPTTAAYELQWRKDLSSVSSVPSLPTLQCHVLAQLCYLLKADYPRLLRHRAYAVSTLHQLGLHQGHKSHSLPALEAETRKRVFWCQYVLDKFASAATGTPQLLRDPDISVEFPADVDDENLNAEGISPMLPGEITKISSALALFRVGRILAKALESLYPSKATYQFSLTALHSLSDELDQWQEELPDHLRLRFHNDKPATNTISCRSPLLSMAYFYTRSLIHRPLLCHGSGSAVSAASIIIAAAAKHQLQIIDLLDERSMNYTFPICKQDLLLNAGFAVLWQTLDLGDDSNLMRDNRKSLNLLISKLARESSIASSDFGRITGAFIHLQDTKSTLSYSAIDLPDSVTTGGIKPKSARKQLQALASRISFTGKSKNEDANRRPGVYQSLSPEGRANSSVSLSSTRSAPVLPTPLALEPDAAPGFPNASAVNLDYFPFSDNHPALPTNNSSSTMLPPRKGSLIPTETSVWNGLIPASAADVPDMFSTISPLALNRPASISGYSADWSGSELWQIGAYDLVPKADVAQSLLSFSEESLTSGEDLLFSTTGSHSGSTGTVERADQSTNNPSSDPYRAISIGVDDEFNFHHL